MQDTTSTAMTEVALGLSMAFFTLLIVALLSMSVPKERTTTEKLKPTTNIPDDLKDNKVIDIQMKNNHSGNSTMQFAFYFKQKFYDSALVLRTIDSFSKEQTLIIAVDPTLAFAEVFALRQQINHPKLAITTSNNAWRTRLQQIGINL
ncbi:hypothetical protein [Colwellia sp. TT2012]|uniref:hypothetical protein n=1 Tax=Colwellia sp. TT2012 TaxID=1720342 RepID=UPI0007108D4E|nr:hypothetical protein [Colwellia sp. TT2012]